MKTFLGLGRSLVRGLLPRRVQAARARRADVERHQAYKNLPRADIFNRIYTTHDWGVGAERFYSGDGSHDPGFVGPYVRAVRGVLESLASPPALVDLGCGDCHVSRQLVDLAASYQGCDIVPELQAHNQARFGSPTLRFACIDIVEDPLPDGDVVLIRQVLQHLSNDDVRTVIGKCGKYQRWIVTEHVPSGRFTPNVDMTSGSGTRLLCGSGLVLTEPPFNVVDYRTRVLCEVPQHGGLIRTTLFERGSAG